MEIWKFHLKTSSKNFAFRNKISPDKKRVCLDKKIKQLQKFLY